jgi:hypothetical protein
MVRPEAAISVDIVRGPLPVWIDEQRRRSTRVLGFRWCLSGVLLEEVAETRRSSRVMNKAGFSRLIGFCRGATGHVVVDRPKLRARDRARFTGRGESCCSALG